MFGSSSKTGLWAWVVVFLGGVMLVADIASLQMLGTKTNQFVLAPGQPAPQPPAATPVEPRPVEPRPVETVEVLVAAKDLPVGTMLTAGEPQWVKKKSAKDAMPPEVVVTEADLIGWRLTRTLRAGDPFDRRDLTKATGPTLPDGHDMVSLHFNPSQGGGFIGPGSRVNVFATLRVADKLSAFPLLVNVLVVAVETSAVTSDPHPGTNTVSFAVTEKQALLVSLAKSRGCKLELILRHSDKTTDADKDYKIEKVIAFLADVPEAAVEVAPAPRPVGERR